MIYHLKELNTSTPKKRRIRYFIPNIFNICPYLILYTHSIEGLSSYMKRHHIETYKMTCEIENSM